ncbi:Glycosyltransferase sdnJ, partial [Lachnellula suecica]
ALFAFCTFSSSINGPMPSSEKSSPSSGSGVEEVRPKKALFMTSSEYGQANVILAVVYELLLRREYEIHVASFTPLKTRIKELNEQAGANGSNAARFHTVAGTSALEALGARDEFIGPFPPGVKGAQETYRVTLPAMATTWGEDEYMAGYKSCTEIVQSVNPDVIVVDPIFSQGLEVCRELKRNCVILSPNTFQDMLRKRQPISRLQFFRYPALSSGFPYPVPWMLIPANIYLRLRMVWILITSPAIKALMAWRKARSLPSLPPIFNIWQPQDHFLVPSTPETDFPCYIEPNVTGCGPILLPVPSVSEIDPALQAWLMRGPTVLINLGSHIRMDGPIAREFAAALKTLLDARPDIQVLWKLKTSGGLSLRDGSNPVPKSKSDSGFKGTGLEEGSLDAISNEVEAGRVKILEWLSVDPLAVLQSGDVVCSVHHGGSNSFHEALSVGVPQIILPCWLDTLEFANRVEYLGIGLYGSRSSAPFVKADELSAALMRVLGPGDEGVRMLEKARYLADSVGKVGGKVRACEKIVEFLESA